MNELEEARETIRRLRFVISNIRMRLPNPPSHGKENKHADLEFCWAQLRADICNEPENESVEVQEEHGYY